MPLGVPVAGLLVALIAPAPLPLDPAPEAPHSPASAADLEAEALYNAGVERFEGGDFAAALAPLEASLALLEDANTRYAYAQTLNRLGRCPEAVREYDRLLGVVPEGSDAQRVLEGAVRACAAQMAATLTEAEAQEEEKRDQTSPPPAVLRLPVPDPAPVGDDPGRSWRRGGMAAMAVGGVSIVAGGTVAAYYGVRGREFSNKLAVSLDEQDAAGCGPNESTSECGRIDGEILAWRENGDRANRYALLSGVVGIGFGLTAVVVGALVVREGTVRTDRWRSERPSVAFVAAMTGGTLVGRF